MIGTKKSLLFFGVNLDFGHFSTFEQNFKT